jgi:hypothetical protein
MKKTQSHKLEMASMIFLILLIAGFSCSAYSNDHITFSRFFNKFEPCIIGIAICQVESSGIKRIYFDASFSM